MTVLVTGAAGYIGRAIVSELVRRNQTVVATDITQSDIPLMSAVTAVCGDLSEASFRARLFEQAFESIIHLAAVPGGASEANPEASAAVNLFATLDLLDRAKERPGFERFVYASSIAVLGGELPRDGVTDETPIQPTLVYGMHKAMCEVAIETKVRRRDLSCVALRLPGIVARPAGAHGLKSAFMSDVFHAIAAGDDLTLPVSADAQMWMMSQQRCAENLVDAAMGKGSSHIGARAITLPALRVRMGDLVDALFSAFPQSRSKISYTPEPALQASFGAYPDLAATKACEAGFRHDGDLAALIKRVFNPMLNTN